MLTRIGICLLAGTFLAAPALAQNAAPGAAGQAGAPPQANQATTQQGAAMQGQQQANVNFVTQNRPDLWRASRLEGVNVYNDRNERIGDITEVLVNQEGRVEAVVIGVGGFLGIGQRDVAVPFDALRWENQPARTAAAGQDAAGGTGAAGTTGMNTAANQPAGVQDPVTTGATTTGQHGAGTAGGVTGAGGAAPGGAAGGGGTTAGTGMAGQQTGAADTDQRWAATRGDAMRDYPERAILANATRDMLQNAPEFRYAR